MLAISIFRKFQLSLRFSLPKGHETTCHGREPEANTGSSPMTGKLSPCSRGTALIIDRWHGTVMKQKPSSRRRRNSNKSILRLPDLEHAKAAVLNSLNSLDAKRGYRHAIDEFVDWYCSEPRLAFNRIVVLRYRSHLESRQLAPGTINLRLGAVRRLAYEAADCGLLSADLAAGIRRVKGVKKLGIRLGNWLTAEQGNALSQAPDRERLKGKRDRALLALLLACGLRRHEAVALTLDHLQQREEHWAIVDLVGKGGHIRTVPVPDWVRAELDDWLAAAAIDRGRLFRRVNKVGRTWGDGMTVKAVWHIVKESARSIGVAKLAPHDLRRTCARLCHASGGELEQMQFLLGHVSVQTTERYLGCKQRIRSAVNDRIGIEPNP
jgi:site-specific recombinase XerD